MHPSLADLRFTLASPLGVAIYPPGATFGPRTLPAEEFEFVWIIEGDAEYRWGGQTLAAPAGSILLCRPGVEDFFRWDERNRTRHAYFHFRLENCPPEWPPVADWPLVRRAVEGDILRPAFRHLLTWRDRGDELLRELTIAQMLAAYVTGEIAGMEVGRDVLPEAVERALAYLHQRMEEDAAEPITLHDLAQAGQVTPEHLCRLFKSTTGLTPAATVRLARLDRAAILLARSNYSIAQIAELCGFASPFHFSRRFKGAFGTSPRALRKDLADGAIPPTPRLMRVSTGAPTPSAPPAARESRAR